MSVTAPASIFGPLVTGHDVEQAVLSTLRKWSGTYIAEAEDAHGITRCSLERVRAWVIGPTLDKWPEDQLPAVVIASPGLAPPPRRNGEGYYRATWRIELGVVCAARTQARSRELSALYLRAHMAIVAQKQSLESFADGVAWLDESYTQLDYDDVRSLYSGSAVFAIDVEDVLSTDAGPTEPDPQADECVPWAPWPLVETYDVDVDNYVVDEPLGGPHKPPPLPPPPPGSSATGAVAGEPGYFTPAGCTIPATLDELVNAQPPIVASPAGAWGSFEYVELGDSAAGAGTGATWFGDHWGKYPPW